MQFLHPSFLWALLALAIPIILHLFHFRRYKKVYFTNVKFLKELKDERNANRKLRNLLVLLMRLLAIAALVFAFAQPYLANKKKNFDKKLVSIFVDNSYSMQGLSRDIPLIDKAKQRAEQIIQAYSETDRFQLLSHDFNGISSKILTKEDAIENIEEINITPSVKNLDVILQRQIQTFKGAQESKSFYFLSDFQKNITNFPNIMDTSYTLRLIPFQTVQENNISIDSCHLLSPTPLLNQTNQLIIRLHNYGAEDQDNVRLNLTQNGQKKPAGTISIKAGQSILDTIQLSFLKPGNHDLVLEIDDYPIQFDDQYYMNIYIEENAKVLHLSDRGSNKYLSALFSSVNELNLASVNSNKVDYNAFGSYSLIILDDLSNLSSGLISELTNFVNKGGNVLVFPSKNGTKDQYNNLFRSLNANTIKQWTETDREVLAVNTDEFIFNKVFNRISNNLILPKTTGNYEFSEFSSTSGEKLLNYRDGSTYLYKYLRGEGQLYVCTAPLDKTINELVVNAEIFVPMLYKMSLAQAQKNRLSYTIGEDVSIKVKNNTDQNEVLFKVQGKEEFIPQQQNIGNFSQINMVNMIENAGFYDIKADGILSKRIAYNFNRKESDLTNYSKSELKEKYGDSVSIIAAESEANISQIIKEREQGIFLWKWCLIFALLFFAIEGLILRFWKG